MKNTTFMIRFLVSAILSFVITNSSTAIDCDKKIKIFLLGGQSNMVGSAKSSNLTEPFSNSFKGIKIWNSSSESWENLSPSAVNKNEQFGPEITFGHTMAALFPDQDIRIVKYAASGTALYNDWAPLSGPQYTEFMNATRGALGNLDASGAKYEIAGMLWLQGESDAQENMAEAYEENLTLFIAHIRETFKEPEMPFIIARVFNYYGGETGQAKIVREAQVKIADSSQSIDWFDTDDCERLDPGHYNAVGIIKIGNRFAKTYNKLIGNINDEH